MKSKIFLIILGIIILFLATVVYFFISSLVGYRLSKNISSPAFGFAGLYGKKDYQLAKQLGVGWIRPQINWETIEPKNDQFNFDELGKIYNQNQKYGFNIMVSLRTGQLDWATKFDKSLCQYKKEGKCPDEYASLPPKDLEATWNNQYGYSKNYYDLVFKTAEHFKGRVDYFVIENEVNTLTFWHGTPEEYLKLRATAYKAAHDANPNAVVVDNGIAGLVWGDAIIRENYCQGKTTEAENFFKIYTQRILTPEKMNEFLIKKPIDCQNPDRNYQFLKATFKEPTFDIASYHFYEPWQTQEAVINWAKEEMNKNGYSKPIICTEGGYFDTLYEPTNKETQKLVAEDLVKLHVVAFSEGIQKWIWLPLSESGTKATGQNYKGLYASNFKKLPAGKAYETMIKKIGGFSKVEKLDLGENIYAFKFLVSQKPVYVLWSTNPVTIDFSSEILGKAKVTKIDGISSIVDASVLSVSESPIFIEKK